MNVVEDEIMKELTIRERILFRLFRNTFVKIYHITRINIINSLL